MDQTFDAMQSTWHINMIRVFIYPSWYYRDNIVPAQEDLKLRINDNANQRQIIPENYGN